MTNPETASAASDWLSIILQSLESIFAGLLERTPHLVAALVILIGVLLITRVGIRIFLVSVLKHTKLRASLKTLFLHLASIFVWISGILVAAIIVFPGLSISKALGAAGLASIAVGFAFKDIFQNFFAGILILWRFPFEPGDFIECGELRGRVVDTELRLTTIRQSDGELLIVPNSHLLINPVRVVTDRDLRRTTVKVGVSYGDDLRHAIRIIKATLKNCGTVSSGEPVKILPCDFGPSSIDIEILYWTDSAPLRERESHAEVITSIKKSFDDAGITIPFPQRTISFLADDADPLTLSNQRAALSNGRSHPPYNS